MPSPFSLLLETHGQTYDVERDSVIIGSYDGISNHEKSTHKPYIGFEPKTDIQRGDWVINSENERFYIEDTITDYFMKEPNQLKAFYLTENEYLHSAPSGGNIFHIENAYGSVIGTQSHVVLNYNDTIQNAKQQISASSSPDKEDLQKIVSLLEMIVNNQVPPQKGLFSKFSAVMERNSWITSTVSSVILNWLITQT